MYLDVAPEQFFVGKLTDRRILARIGEEIEGGEFHEIAVIFRFFCWPCRFFLAF